MSQSQENTPTVTMSNKDVAEVASYLKRTVKSNTNTHTALPIRTIDGIPVEVVFNCESKRDQPNTLSYIACYIYLAPFIEYNMAEFVVRQFDESFTVEMGILLLLKKLNSLRFDQQKGIFKTVHTRDGDEEPTITQTFMNLFKGFKNLELTTGECCVCFESTETTTSCNHQLCIACYSKLDNVKEGWSEYSRRTTHMKSCPLCRQLIKKMSPDHQNFELHEELFPESEDEDE